MRHFTLSLVTMLALMPAVRADEAKLAAKVEKTSPPEELGAPVRELLSDQAIRVTNAKGEAYCTIWLRKTVDSTATPEQVKSGLTYREIKQSTVVGAVQFPHAWIDFRKQKIAAGTYTLRLGFQPMDGDHMGTAPYNEFFLLCPAAKDQKPDILDVKDLHELSGHASGGSHPAVMMLIPNTKPEETVKLEPKPGNLQVVLIRQPVMAGGQLAVMGLGITVQGQTTAE
jgi:hypothetical protein